MGRRGWDGGSHWSPGIPPIPPYKIPQGLKSYFAECRISNLGKNRFWNQNVMTKIFSKKQVSRRADGRKGLGCREPKIIVTGPSSLLGSQLLKYSVNFVHNIRKKSYELLKSCNLFCLRYRGQPGPMETKV